MKRYPIKILFCLIGMFFIFRAGPGFCGWVDRLEDWSRRFHVFEENSMDTAGWWVAREIGGRFITPYIFWEDAVARFNPIGNALDRMEEPIPGLDIRGNLKFKMRTPLHGNIYEDKFPSTFIINPATGRQVPCPPSNLLCGKAGHADPDLHEASWLTELEFEYKPLPWLRFDAIFNYRYDAAYDWDDEFKKLYKGNRTDLEIQGFRTVELILRELFVNITRHPWEITLGKQQVAWGKMFTRVMDVINPDFLGVGIDESGRHPLWMARFMYWWKDWHFEYVFTPDWERNIGLDSSRVRPQTRIQGRLPGPFFATPPQERPFTPGNVRYDKPGDGFSDSQMGFRLGFEKGKWETDLAYWWGWTHHTLFGGGRLSSPVFRRVLGISRRGLPVVALERQEIRLHFISLSVVRPFYKMYRDWVMRLENVLVKDYQMAVRSEAFKVGSRFERFDPDGRKKKDWLVSAFEISTSVFRDFDISFTSIISMFLPYDSRLHDNRPVGFEKLHNIDHRIRFGIGKSFYQGMCSIRFSWDAVTSQGGGRFDESFSYSPSEYLSFSLGFRSWYGTQWNGNDAQHNASDEFSFGITYSF